MRGPWLRGAGAAMTAPLAREPAERLALDALAWMAAQPEVLGAFLAASGTGPEALRRAAAEPEFLGFVLDHLLADETALTAFAAERGIPPELPMRARAALPGGDLPHWT